MLLTVAVILSGCQAQLDAAGEPGDTQVIVGRSSSGLTVEAPAWRPPQTLIELCPVAPTTTFASAVDAGTLTLSPDCRSYGTVDTTKGLTARLDFAALDAGRRARFEAATTWYLLLIGVRGGSTDRVFRTAVQPVAIDPAITPGPSDPPTGAPPATPAGSSSTGPSISAGPSAGNVP